MLAFTFPGQGSQRPAMGAAWLEHPAWSRVLEASSATGVDVSRLLLEADQAELTETHNAQLSTFVLSMVIHDAVVALGTVPDFAAGHSLGEYTALVASGVLSFEDACRIVFARGHAMKAAAAEKPGTMFAVLGLDDDKVEVACRRADGDAWVANYNSDGQVIISGDPEALERAGTIAKELGAKRAMGIPVGGAFHTPYMASARTKLRAALADATFHDAGVPVVANVDAAVHTVGNEWADLCSAQLCSPVRWRQSTATLLELGATTLVEIGPGSVLTGLAKRNAPGTKYLSVAEPKDLEALLGAIEEMRDRADQRAVYAEASDAYEGERLDISDRLVVSTANGLFTELEQPIVEGAVINIGDSIGTVGDVDITTPFAGTYMKTMVIPGQRIKVGQPIAWLGAGSTNGNK